MGLGGSDVNAGATERRLNGLYIVPVASPGIPKLEPPGSPLSQELQGDQLERFWEAHWQGEPANFGQQASPGSLKGQQNAAVEGRGGAVPQLLRNLKEIGHKLRTLGKRKSDRDDEPDVQARLDSTMAFRVPRYPSWVEWD